MTEWPGNVSYFPSSDAARRLMCFVAHVVGDLIEHFRRSVRISVRLSVAEKPRHFAQSGDAVANSTVDDALAGVLENLRAGQWILFRIPIHIPFERDLLEPVGGLIRGASPLNATATHLMSSALSHALSNPER
jgi:hypothetical protein